MADDRLIPGSVNDPSAQAYNEMAERLGTLDITCLLVYLVDLVDASVLPHLIEQFHVAGIEGGALAESDADRRELIKQSIAMHKRKGTPGSIKRAIRAAGFGEVTIIERPGELNYDGTYSYNGLNTYGLAAGAWAHYHVRLERPITNDQAVLLRALCAEFAPARCRLLSLIYTEVAIRYNATAVYDGSYNHGTA